MQGKVIEYFCSGRDIFRIMLDECGKRVYDICTQKNAEVVERQTRCLQAAVRAIA